MSEDILHFLLMQYCFVVSLSHFSGLSGFVISPSCEGSGSCLLDEESTPYIQFSYAFYRRDQFVVCNLLIHACGLKFCTI